MNLQSLDVVKILGYGLSGFAFLLVFLAFMLLRKEQDKPEPRKMIIQTIQMFMGLCLVLSIAVGVISIPISRNNSRLQQVLQDGTVIASQSEKAEKSANDLATRVLSNNLSALDISKSEKDIAARLDSIDEMVSENRPEDAASLQAVDKLKASVQSDFIKLKTPNQNEDTLKAAALRIQLSTRQAKTLALPKSISN